MGLEPGSNGAAGLSMTLIDVLFASLFILGAAILAAIAASMKCDSLRTLRRVHRVLRVAIIGFGVAGAAIVVCCAWAETELIRARRAADPVPPGRQTRLRTGTISDQSPPADPDGPGRGARRDSTASMGSRR